MYVEQFTKADRLRVSRHLQMRQASRHDTAALFHHYAVKGNKKMKYIVGFLFITITLQLILSCSNDNYEAKFILLGGNDFILEVNRISEHPNVQFPSDQLDENDYREIDHGSEYEVSFSENIQAIWIMNDSISGTIIEDTEEYKKYDLNKGLFAGGRFVVWINEGRFEAEYTVYGSGVPIIRSERGYLQSFKKP